MKLPATSPNKHYVMTDGTDDISSPELDCSGLRDVDTFRRFQMAADYCFDYSDDSDDGGYDPSRECFVVGNAPVAPAPAQTLEGAVHSAHISTADSAAGARDPPNVVAAQGARLDELEDAQRQLDDERAQLHQQLGRDPNPTPACVRARDVKQHIINDDRDVVDGMPVFKGASQNLAVATILLRKIPEPATPQEKEMNK
jgi:hypothetical protein